MRAHRRVRAVDVLADPDRIARSSVLDEVVALSDDLGLCDAFQHLFYVRRRDETWVLVGLDGPDPALPGPDPGQAEESTD